MQHNTDQGIDLDEIDNKKEDKRLELILELEEKKFQHKVARRPVALYWVLLLNNLAIIVLASAAIGIVGGNSYLGGWSTFIAFVFGITFIGFTVYFFLDYEDNITRHGFRFFHRLKQLLSLKEEIDQTQIQLRILDEFIAARRPPSEKYQEGLPFVIKQYQNRANYNRRLYYSMQIIIIFCSLLVTGLTSGLNNVIRLFGNPWVTPAISFAVSFLTALVTLFRFRERGHNLQQTADAIEYEISCYEKRIFGYKNLADQDAFTKFAEEVERLRNEQRKRQQQLEQSSDTKQAPE